MKYKLLLALGVILTAVSCFSDVPVYGQTAVPDEVTAAPEKVTYESIQEAWRQRQKKFASVKCTLMIDRKEPEVFRLTPTELAKVRQDPVAREKWASKCFVPRLEVQMSVHGDCVGYHDRPLTPKGEPQFSTFVKHFVSDGVAAKSFCEHSDVFSHPVGEIFTEPRCPMEALVDLLPITWQFGNQDYLMPKSQPIHLTEASAATLVDSHACLVLEFPGNSFCKTYWLAPDMDYSILRYTQSQQDGKVSVQLDSRYERREEGCWVPTSWTVTLSSDPPRFVHVVATNYEINPTFPEDEFQISFFPPGTVVSDGHLAAEDGQYEGFLVKPDGSKRMIARNEVCATYEELLKTETGKAVTQIKRATREYSLREHPWRVFWLVTTASVLIALCGLFYVRQRRKRYGT